MVERLRETGHPNIQGYRCFESWNSERKKNKDTIHFNADASNAELLFRAIHSAKQLSVYGAVSSWCEEFGQRPKRESRSRKGSWQKKKSSN